MRLLKDVVQATLFYTGALYLIELVLARLRRSKGVRILFCHHVWPEDCAAFERALRYLKRRYDIMSLEDAVQRLAGNGELTRDAAVITFDDGYADNYENALPILRKLDVPATFFITTGPLDGEQRLWFDQVREWVTQTRMQRLELDWINLSFSTVEDRRLAGDTVVEALKALPDEQRLSRLQTLAAQLGGSNGPPIDRNRTLSPQQLREMAKMPGVAIGGHTVSHPILPRCNERKVRQEVRRSAEHIEDIADYHPTLFAYPNGDYEACVVRILQEEGYQAAVTISEGVNYPGQDPYVLVRVPLGIASLHRFAWHVSTLRWAMRGARPGRPSQRQARAIPGRHSLRAPAR